MRNMLLNGKNITKTYFTGDASKELVVLDRLNFEMESGTIAAISGLSGSGKSTLLHILGSLDRPDFGEIYFKDRMINELNDTERAEFRNKNLGFIFQFHHLMPELTALENVIMPKLIAGKSFAKAKKQAYDILSKLDMEARKDHFPNQLSGGEKQRVAVARALINNPELILADEPTGNIDIKHSEELLQLLFDLNKGFSTSVLIVTHNLEIAKRADKTYNLKDGKLERLK